MSEGSENVKHGFEVEITNSEASKKLKTSRKKVGKRCMAYGCGNCTANCTMSMHSLPGKMPGERERFSPLHIIVLFRALGSSFATVITIINNYVRQE